MHSWDRLASFSTLAMTRISIFADESGNFDFSRKPAASRYFILTTIATADFAVDDALLALRREMAWTGLETDSEFHATSDSLEVRREVFALLRRHEFRVDVTIMEKAKAEPQTRVSEERFYQYAGTSTSSTSPGMSRAGTTSCSWWARRWAPRRSAD